MTGDVPEVQVKDLFETPLITGRLPDAEALNAELKSTILRRRAADPGVRRSNWFGWQSQTDMVEWGGAAAEALTDYFLEPLQSFHRARPGPMPAFLWSVEMWANVSVKGSANEAHTHPRAMWSAVYYVDAGDSGPEAQVGGELVLYDPRLPASRMLPFDLRYRRPDGQVYHSLSAVQPIPGNLVMFPPWLLHSVHPYHGEAERISIAMNANAIPAG